MYEDNRNWSLYNQQLVNRGKTLTLFLKEKTINFKEELENLNKGKQGSPYQYPMTLIWIGFAIKCVYHLGYRQLQGHMEEVCQLINFKIPDFRTFWWRVDKMEKQGVKFNVPKGKKIAVAVDSSGLKIVNDGEYRTKKYKKMKDWVKFHASVNEETNEALTVVITNDNVGDCREFTTLLDPIVKITDKVDADGAYDSNQDFEYCKRNGLRAGIPVRSNASIKGLGARCDAIRDQFGIDRKMRWGRPPNWLRNLSLSRKKEVQDEWRKKTKHGDRWSVEGFYSRFKRQYGEFVFSKKQKNVYNEVVMKTNILNMFITM